MATTKCQNIMTGTQITFESAFYVCTLREKHGAGYSAKHSQGRGQKADAFAVH